MTYTIEDTEGSRQVAAEDFPLAIGGAEADIRLNGFDAEMPLAYLGLEGGDLFVQPADEVTVSEVTVAGQVLTSSQWLHDGDLLRVGAAHLAVEMDEGGTRFVLRKGPGAQTSPPPARLPPARLPQAHRVQPIVFQPGQKLGGSRPGRRIRPVSVLIVLLLAALTCIAAFVFTSRSIVVHVEPTPDRMAIEDGLAIDLGGRHLLRPGTYTLVADKEGYRPLNVDLEVNRETSQVFRFELEKLPGLLEIRLADNHQAPVDGAEILIGGELAATTPLAGPLEVPAGEHEIRIRAPRYREFTTLLAIEGAGASQTLEAELVALWAPVTFASKPGGATVRLGGASLGRTPLTTKILEGTHTYEVLLAGHQPHRGRIQVTASQARTVPTVVLTPSNGNLLLVAEPDGSTVTVGGVYRGQTPLGLRLEPGRAHQIQVSKAGYDPETLEVEVSPNESRELRVALTVREGELQITSWPPDAELLVNGEVQDKSSGTWRLRAMPHEIEVRKAGFTPFSTTVTPIPGIPQSIEATLERLEVVEVKKIAQTLNSSEGHELRRVEPGRFLMGASRREPGRRSNEVLREVELTRPFHLATQEVSNQQFRRFKKEHLSGQVGGHTLDLNNHPAVRVTWEQAAEYCNWLSAKEGLPLAYVQGDGHLVLADPVNTGYRLPTEAEWAWAARYPGGKTATKFPWGDTLPVAPGTGNYADSSASGILPAVMTAYTDGFPSTSPVDSFDARPSGLFYNLGGNVAEWVHDLYAIRPAGSDKVARDPTGPTDGEFRVIRGASWMHGSVTELRLTFRDYGNKPRPDVGFRVARYVQE